MINQNQYPDVSKLQWAVDIFYRIERLIDLIENNLNYNQIRSKDTSLDLSLQNLTKEKLVAVNSELERQIGTEIANHPGWAWLNSIKGIDPMLMGKVVGGIRFWPPEKNITNANTGKERWAHSCGALLMYCGLGVYDKQREVRSMNLRLKKYIFDQTVKFIAQNNSYAKYYEMKRGTKENVSLSSPIDPVQNALDIRALRMTAILFMTHLWYVVQSTIDESNKIFLSGIAPYNDPWKMVDFTDDVEPTHVI